ncbi:MAG: tripartite tricarboxylate transporter TctB family protein, partial [Chloroflexota bacterium]|nr:tripartite tricarboxylate transporter TctB family protein [Chloroflexota bacterium]
AMAWQAAGLPYLAPTGPGAGFFPLWLALIGVVLAVLIAITAHRTPGLPSGPTEHGGRAGLLRVALAAGGLLVMILLIPVFGLILAVLLYLLFLALAIERLSPAVGIGMSLGTIAFVYVVFARLLRVPFPTGPLGF